MNDASNTVTGGQDFDSKPFGPACEAYRNLLGHQRQLDMDGVEVGVSRQALDQILSAYAQLTRLRDALTETYRDRAIKAEAGPTDEALARTIYIALGHEDVDPWDDAVRRRKVLGRGMTLTQSTCVTAAGAIRKLWREAR